MGGMIEFPTPGGRQVAGYLAETAGARNSVVVIHTSPIETTGAPRRRWTRWRRLW